MLLGDVIGRYSVGELASSSASAVTAAVGTFALTFQSVVAPYSMPAGVGAFSITGSDTALAYSLLAAQGTFTLAGQSAGLSSIIVMTVTPFIDGARVQVGLSALGEAALGQLAQSSQVTFALALQSGTSQFSTPAESGAFTLSGQLASLFVGTILNPSTGYYTMTGYDAVHQISMPAASGSFSISGNVVEFINRRPRIRAFPRVGNPTFSGRSLGRGFKAKAYG